MIEYVDAGDGYRPGACNIGPAEVRRRQRFGFIGLAGAAALGAALLLVDAPDWSRLLVALPLAVSLAGFIQARSRFCAAYGFAGVSNMGELGEETAVEDVRARAADRRRAFAIFGAAALGGLAAGVLFALLPL